MVGNILVFWIFELLGILDFDCGFWVKLEGFNFGGMKDCFVLYMVECVCVWGDIVFGVVIVELIGGILGLGLVFVGKVYWYLVILVIDLGLEFIIVCMLIVYGVGVDMVMQLYLVGGW